MMGTCAVRFQLRTVCLRLRHSFCIEHSASRFAFFRQMPEMQQHFASGAYSVMKSMPTSLRRRWDALTISCILHKHRFISPICPTKEKSDVLMHKQHHFN